MPRRAGHTLCLFVRSLFMRHHKDYPHGIVIWVLAFLSCATAATVRAQGAATGGSLAQASVRGSVVLPNGSPVSEAVKITLKVMRGDQSIIYSDQQGRFEINNLAPGDYVLEVEADRNPHFDIATERIRIQRNAPTFVTIVLQPKAGERTTTTSDRTVSVAMLDQKVPSAAKREYEKATRFLNSGRTEDSIEALRRALAIYPDYLMARNDLGAQLLELERFAEAEIELRAAVRIDPNSFNAQLNLGVVLVRENKFAEAIKALDKALSIEPAAPSAHLYAGMASAGNSEYERAEKDLRAAYDLGGVPYNVALVHLGVLYIKRGQRELALKTLQAYLRESPDGPNVAEVQKMIATLR
jgi:tetratricopeptide (TPR) repeat protein